MNPDTLDGIRAPLSLITAAFLLLAFSGRAARAFLQLTGWLIMVGLFYAAIVVFVQHVLPNIHIYLIR